MSETRAQQIRIQVDALDSQGADVDEIAFHLGITVARVEQILEQIESGRPLKPVPTEPVVMQYAEAPKPPPAPARLVAPKPRAPRTGAWSNGREPAKCGTVAGYQRHRKTLKEPACQPCKDAAAEYRRELEHRRGRSKPRTYQPCGTNAAHQRHLALGETPCEPCSEAHKAYQREQYARTKAKAQPA